MSYFRVIPRDLFNEAKLLKGLGKIALMIHDNSLPYVTCVHEDERAGFKIFQNPTDGSINVSNLYFFDNNGTPIYFYHPLNCKDNWPLMMEYEGDTYYVFDEKGNFMLDKEIFNKRGSV
jgi:hypothetical protein